MKVIAENKFGDTASSTLYRVHTQLRAGRPRSLLKISLETQHPVHCTGYIHSLEQVGEGRC